MFSDNASNQPHMRRIMRKLITIVALAASVISVSAFGFAAAANAQSHRYNYHTYYNQQNGGSGIPWVDDHAKGPVL
jgi:Spy/CpxP family protein refolding chaperone